MPYFTKVFLLDFDAMERIIPWIIGYIPESILQKKGEQKIELALEELLVNMIEHAYKKQLLPVCVYVECSSTNVLIQLRDFGVLFDPLTYRQKNSPPTKIENMVIGGQGIKFVKAVMDHLDHTYDQGMNTLTCRLCV